MRHVQASPSSIELRAEPPPGRPGGEGFVLRIESSGANAARAWVALGARQPPTEQLRQQGFAEISWRRASELVDALVCTLRHATSADAIGEHATVYRLAVECDFNSVAYTWWNQPPDEWAGRSKIVAALEAIARRASQQLAS